ncbi:MAG: hypothetical protein DRP45_08190 [Candidatus Zixiibacteriota bacterium]|nr:MAG: hypothetical protein DRP45_08190 [candidate division Zixibacteria bacterium]
MERVSKLTKRILRWLLPWQVLHIVYRRHALRYLKNLSVSIDPNRKTIVVLNHFFDQDVRALSLANKDYNLVVIDTVTLFRGAKIFFDEDVRELHVPYDTADPSLIARYRRECELIFDHLRKEVNVSLIVTASDIFYWVREFIGVARDRGVKTVVLDKEGTLSPYDFEAEARRIREFAPFMSDHIFVWSERQREFWNRIGVTDERISVIGQPRSDLLHCEQREEVDRLFHKAQPIVTLFSYMDDAYIPVKLIRSEGLKWEMKTETHDEFYRLAQVNPSYNFVIKTHPQQPDLVDLKRKYERDNLRVIGGSAVANELLQRSELIIAFQTTAVIEAMLLKRRVVYTYWDKLVERLKDDLLPFHRASGIVVSRSFEDFRNKCASFFGGDSSVFEFTSESTAARDEFVNQYLHKPDGHVCDRFLESVERFMS